MARNSERNSAELDGRGAQAGNRAASKQAGPPGRGAGKQRACQWDPNPKRVGLTIVSNKNSELS